MNNIQPAYLIAWGEEPRRILSGEALLGSLDFKYHRHNFSDIAQMYKANHRKRAAYQEQQPVFYALQTRKRAAHHNAIVRSFNREML